MKALSLSLSVLAAAGLALGPALAESRTWTQAATGKTIQAEFAGSSDGKVMLKLSNGQTVPVALNTLSQEDQDWVTAQAATASSSAGDGDWPQWRGPNQDDISAVTGINKDWSTPPAKLWTYDQAGLGYSGYSIVGGTLYTLGTRDSDLYLIAVNVSDGSERWASKIGSDPQQGYNTGWGHGPRSTPTFDDGMLYALGPDGTLVGANAEDGSVVWSKNLKSDFGGQAGGWGFSESPVIDGDKLLVAPGGNESGIVALDKKTGAEIWKATDVKPGKAEYASILVTEINGTRQYVKFFEKEIVSVKADDGSLLWSSEWPPGRTAVIPTPIIDGNEVYITSGYGAGGKKFTVSSSNETSDVWMNTEMKNHHGGVVKIGDYVYGFSDGPGLMCQDWETGELVWNEKGQGLTKGAVHAVDGMLICLNEQDGVVTLVKATPDGFESGGSFTLDPQSENRHPQGKIWTHPVVVGGKLFLRDQELIHCYDLGGT